MVIPPVADLKRSKYRLLGLVGQGQFGRVYCAVHRKTGRLVALKDLDRQRFPTHKFLRELRFLLSLQHPNIVTCHSLEHTRTGRYLVMDYCEGGTLRGLMEEEVHLHPIQSLRLVLDVLAGLDHAHRRGIVHCDIKPENILLSLQPTGWVARISDFGIARLSQEMAKEGTGNTGSPAYMAPERFYGQYSHSSDLYAVGVLLFESLVGYRPFSGLPTELMSAHLNKPVKVPDSIPKSLKTVILTALQKLPARRFKSAGDMITAVQQAASLDGLKLELQDSAIAQPLLQPRTSLQACAFFSQYQEPLSAPLQILLVENNISQSIAPLEPFVTLPQTVYRASNNRVEYQTYPKGLLVQTHNREAFNLLDKRIVALDEPIRKLLLRPQGCFAITQRRIYLVPSDVVSGSGSTVSQAPPFAPRLLTQFTTEFVATVDSQGRWLATATLNPTTNISTLAIWQLPDFKIAVSPSSSQSMSLFQLMAIDSNHLAVFSHGSTGTDLLSLSGKAERLETMGTLLEIFTRRGKKVGAISLPIQFHQAVLTLTPYRLVALEANQPNSLLLIDLKPLRISRIGLEISPHLLSIATWGYILADKQGQIVFLDKHGQGIGRINAPINPTEIASFNSHGLLIANWHNGQGTLHTVDLRQLDLEMLF